eukprot:gene14330-15821_t
MMEFARLKYTVSGLLFALKSLCTEFTGYRIAFGLFQGLFLLKSTIRDLASASWLSDITKGIREGVEDAYEDGKKVVQSAGEKVEKTVDAHPLLKEHKINLHKLIKKAGKDVEKWHKKFAKKFGLKDNKEADKKFHKHWKMINKWMSTLTKNDTDGNEVHQIPFVPHVNVHNDKSSEEEERQKSLDVFKKLAFMWKEEVESKIEKKGKDLLGWDEEKIHPKVEKKEAKEDEKKEEPLFGRDELEIEPKYVKEKKPSVPFLLFKFEDEDALMKKQAEKVAAEQEAMSTIRKTSEELIDEEVLKGLKKEAEELKKKSKEQKEVSAEEFFKKAQDIGKDWGKNEMETKKKVESPENQMPDKSVNFKKIEATIIKEQKFYAEAEKQWKEEMEKKAKEMSKKTTEQKEITEELKEPKEITEEMKEPEEE